MGTRLRLNEKLSISQKVFYIWCKTISIENLFVYLAILTDLLPFALFLAYYNRNKKENSLWVVLCFFLLFDFFTNVILLYFIPNHKYHKYVYPIFTLIETLLFARFYFLT